MLRFLHADCPKHQVLERNKVASVAQRTVPPYNGALTPRGAVSSICPDQLVQAPLGSLFSAIIARMVYEHRFASVSAAARSVQAETGIQASLPG